MHKNIALIPRVSHKKWDMLCKENGCWSLDNNFVLGLQLEKSTNVSEL